jgi:ribosomal protein S2
MDRIPDIVIIIGQAEEINAVKNKKIRIRSITILDTDCDPSLADLLIPQMMTQSHLFNYF